jgi:ubiquinone/menaquinone biosynthesis C-methylase UbiE
MKLIERDWNWWAYFWRVIHRQTIKGIDKWDRNVVKFIIKVLDCKRGDKILDLGSGSGEHTRFLAKKGIKCVGVEITPSLVSHARKKAKQENVKVKYVIQDMRKIDYKEEFDYCIIISGTFGFFSNYQNLRLLNKIRKALKPEGKLLMDIKNAKNPGKSGKSWMQINNGYLLGESKYDFLNHRESGEYIFIDKTGKLNIMKKDLKRESQRFYTISEIKQMLHKSGLKFLNAYCGYKLIPKKYAPIKYIPSYKNNITIIAQKPR